MTNKSTYWIADAEGTKALVEGADQRDYWTKVRGWSEASEPEGLEFVWLRSDLLPDSAPTRLNWVAANDKAWTDNGFRPCPPPEPVNLALPPEHPSLCRGRRGRVGGGRVRAQEFPRQGDRHQRRQEGVGRWLTSPLMAKPGSTG
jgi:hypothetical protein